MDWLHLCSRLMNVSLDDHEDAFFWNLTTSDLFTVKSMYEDLMNDHTPFYANIYENLKSL
jgi:hypothetical protein